MKVADRAKLCSSAKSKRWGREYGRFLRRYRLEGVPKHISESCLVVFATEYAEDKDGRQYEEPVALKFMYSTTSFRAEIEKRQTTSLSKYVMPLKAFFTSQQEMELSCSHIPDRYFGVEGLHEELCEHLVFETSQEFCHLLVMERGAGVDLHDVINHQNIAGRDFVVVISIAQEIAKTLQVLNEECLVFVDNTLLGPVFQSPLLHGADVVLYSATCFLGGHNDLSAGIALTNSEDLIYKINGFRTFLGAVLSPDVAWMLTRSLETVWMRMERQAQKATKIASALAGHPHVTKVYFPGNYSSETGTMRREEKTELYRQESM